MHISEPEVPPGVAVREFFVVKTEKPQNGGVQIVDVDLVQGRLEAKFVSGAVDLAFDNRGI